MRYNINMFSFIDRTKLVIVLLILILALIPLNQVFGNDFRIAGMGSLFLFASDNGPASDPPALLPTAGASFAWSIIGPLRIELTADVYFTNYEYNPLGYPMACNPENRYSFVIGFITAVQATGAFSVGSDIYFRVFGGPAADFRIVTQAIGLHPTDIAEADRQTALITDYFWGEGRWFSPVAGIGMDFPLNENFLLGFDLRAWFPIYKLWTNDNTPAIDGWRFGAGLRITPRGSSR